MSQPSIIQFFIMFLVGDKSINNFRPPILLHIRDLPLGGAIRDFKFEPK